MNVNKTIECKVLISKSGDLLLTKRSKMLRLAGVQKVFQNGSHKLLFKTPYFLDRSKFNMNNGVYNGNYFYSGYYNPLTLWGR